MPHSRRPSRMPHSRRPWSEDELAKLKSMAGKLPAEEIAAELGRSPAAINVTACKQGVSLRTRPRHSGRSGRNGVDVSRIEGQDQRSNRSGRTHSHESQLD